MNSVDLSKIDLEQGLSRLYDAIWGINLTYWCLKYAIDGLYGWQYMLGFYGVLPYFMKKVIAWVYRGFKK